MINPRTRCIALSSLKSCSCSRIGNALDFCEKSINSQQPRAIYSDCKHTFPTSDCFLGGHRAFSTERRSMRSKVERRMQLESGKTYRELRRARKLKKKLMTDDERILFNLKRAKKKVALLLQKLKKYELPELPPPVHDPELLTPEQLQAYKKIGFKNKNYVPVGVRGLFGGVVLNMHMHWKFHETVQVCCDNCPKERVRETANMLARLSGGIVVDIHNVKTIIMFRGRNYRQPKQMTPFNTLTKRKALFKARFEQALDSQRLNIKRLEQELRRKGLNPEDPVSMASIQRVAATFFNAIEKREGSPYVSRDDESAKPGDPHDTSRSLDDSTDSDQEELDRFIAEIEDSADQEFKAEEAAEKEERGRMRYWNRENFENGGVRDTYGGAHIGHHRDTGGNMCDPDAGTESEDMLNEVDNAMWGSSDDEEPVPRGRRNVDRRSAQRGSEGSREGFGWERHARRVPTGGLRAGDESEETSDDMTQGYSDEEHGMSNMGSVGEDLEGTDQNETSDLGSDS